MRPSEAVGLGKVVRAGAPGGVRRSFWRPLAMFRWVTLGYVGVLLTQAVDDYARPTLGWVFFGVMAAWTTVMSTAAPRADARGRRGFLLALVVTDVTVCAASVLATRLVDTAAHIERGGRTFPATWAGAGVLTAALVAGTMGGLVAGAVVAVATILERGELSDSTSGSAVLLLLTGAVCGYLVRTALRAEATLAGVLEQQAAAAERDRLTRGVHDGALQTLALIAREAPRGLPPQRVATLAAEQEVALRRLLRGGPMLRVGSRVPGPGAGSSPARGSTDVADVAGLLEALAHSGRDGMPVVTVATPGAPVPLPSGQAAELVAAVRAALDNVVRHAGPGSSAWLLVEDEGDNVIVTVRDDGGGMPPGRLDEAAREGRLGFAASVSGRVRDLGGSVAVTTGPGEGTEVELRVPRPRR